MNFLAHLYLSGDDENLLIGNFIADGVRGKAVDLYPPLIKNGIILHRKIDAFTDSHPIVRKTVQKLRKSSAKYAPVVSDVIYDHFLAHNWSLYSPIPLEVFASEKYRVLKRHREVMPIKMQDALDHMIDEDWLVNYSKVSGIARTLKDMSERVNFDNNMPAAIRDLELDYNIFQEEFAAFFSQLRQYVEKEIKKSGYTE